jgi:hypothetical protein
MFEALILNAAAYAIVAGGMKVVCWLSEKK